jgi:hypothetical protein
METHPSNEGLIDKNMVPEGQRVYSVTLIGTLGIGKSTLLNRSIADETDCVFKTDDGPRGCTTTFKVAYYNKIPVKKEFFDPAITLKIMDTPGTNDPNFDLLTWESALRNEKDVLGSAVDLVLATFQYSIRPSTADKADLITIFNLVKGLEPENVAFVFTFMEN